MRGMEPGMDGSRAVPLLIEALQRLHGWQWLPFLVDLARASVARTPGFPAPDCEEPIWSERHKRCSKGMRRTAAPLKNTHLS